MRGLRNPLLQAGEDTLGHFIIARSGFKPLLPKSLFYGSCWTVNLRLPLLAPFGGKNIRLQQTLMLLECVTPGYGARAHGQKIHCKSRTSGFRGFCRVLLNVTGEVGASSCTRTCRELRFGSGSAHLAPWGWWRGLVAGLVLAMGTEMSRGEGMGWWFCPCVLLG